MLLIQPIDRTRTNQILTLLKVQVHCGPSTESQIFALSSENVYEAAFSNKAQKCKVGSKTFNENYPKL